MSTTNTATDRNRRRIGSHRTINGERCMLQRYTANGLAKYRRPNGDSVTIGHQPKRRRKRRSAAPPINTKVRVRIAGRHYGGRVIKRSPLLILVTQPCPFRGLKLQRPSYKIDRRGK